MKNVLKSRQNDEFQFFPLLMNILITAYAIYTFRNEPHIVESSFVLGFKQNQYLRK